MVLWLISGIVGGIAVVGYVQYRSRRHIYRPLSSRQPARQANGDIPLGMEAIDLDHVARTTRRNESLERATTNWMRKGTGIMGSATETHIEPLADDETYAARYHAAFHKDRSKD